jgi:hypothetical protein
MLLIIGNNQKASVVKENFNKLFPYLKLEFFRKKHGLYKDNNKKDVLLSDMILRAKPGCEENDMVISGDTTVADLERRFCETFGISTQVFRKSGKSWIETSVTDDWTLKHQNDEGKELSSFAR